MTLLLMAFIFLSLVAALLALAGALFSPASPMGVRLNTLLGYGMAIERAPAFGSRSEQWLQSLGKALPKSEAEISRNQRSLIQAGYRESRHVKIYYGLRVLSALIQLVGVLLSGWFVRFPILLFVLPAWGYMLPKLLLNQRIKTRRNAIQIALPDALDLVIVCVEAGLGLDQAFGRVATELRHAHPALSSELGLVTVEIRAGKPRVEALRNLAGRTGLDDIRKFVAVVQQAERFGTSVANSLRIYAEAFRTERRQRAEERAAKTGIKMIPVLVLFLFPVLFIVLLGPMVISVIRNVLPELNR